MNYFRMQHYLYSGLEKTWQFASFLYADQFQELQLLKNIKTARVTYYEDDNHGVDDIGDECRF